MHIFYPFLCFNWCMQDIPGWFGTWVCVLEGEKHVALWEDWVKRVDKANPAVWQNVSSVQKLRKIKRDVRGWSEHVLEEGDAVFVPGGVWHAAVNTKRCISFNVSICAPQALLDSTCQAIQGVGNMKVTGFGHGMRELLEEQIERVIQPVENILNEEGTAAVFDLPYHSLQRVQKKMADLSTWAWCINNLDASLVLGATDAWKDAWLHRLQKLQIFPKPGSA